MLADLDVSSNPRTRIRGSWLRAALAKTALVVCLLAFVGETAVQAQTLTILHAFAGPPHDGAIPRAAVLIDAAGNLNGTTAEGGSSNNGTIFKIDSSGTESVLYNFAGAPDGVSPNALIADGAGNFYGTSTSGGTSNRGTVFKFDSSKVESVLYSFTGPPCDGSFPDAALVTDKAGNLYGTTQFGGSSDLGTVFKIDPSGTETVLHSFTGPPSDGRDPTGLLIDAAGNLYGTGGGGSSSRGTVFKVEPSGTESVLYSFEGSRDGGFPNGPLVMDTAGNLYGTTNEGGSLDNGTVFKLDSSGTESVLYSFKDVPDGKFPPAGIIRDSAGNLFGTTFEGGSATDCFGGPILGCGTIFELDSSGSESVLHRFVGSDGGFPNGPLVMDTAGNLYGTTIQSGTVANPGGAGVVFKLTPSVTFASLIDQVNQFVKRPQVATRMVAKLEAAEAAAAKGNQKMADRRLAAFIRRISALSGKSLTSAQAATLTQEAKRLMI